MPVLTRPQRKTRRRGKRPTVAVAAVPTSIDFTTPNIDITFPSVVVLSGIPQFLTDTGKLPTAAAKTAPNVVRLTYDTPGVVTTITVPSNDPAIRSQSGGYVPAGTFPAT